MLGGQDRLIHRDGEVRAGRRVRTPSHHSACRRERIEQLQVLPSTCDHAHHGTSPTSQPSAEPGLIGGTYGDVVAVATEALQDAQQRPSTVAVALHAADDYFTGPLGLNYRSPVRIPCSRLALRTLCG